MDPATGRTRETAELTRSRSGCVPRTAARAMDVSTKRKFRLRMLASWAGLFAICAQAASFFSCSFGTAGPLPIVPLPPPTPSLAISVSPATIVLGQSALLTWSSSGVTACTAAGAWSGPQTPQGSTRVTPATSGTFAYVLNCSTAGGSIAQSATLTVNAMAALGRAHMAVDTRQGSSVVRTDLVADVASTPALSEDPNLTEPWGLVLADKLSAVIASRKSSRSTSYDGAICCRRGRMTSKNCGAS